MTKLNKATKLIDVDQVYEASIETTGNMAEDSRTTLSIKMRNVNGIAIEHIEDCLSLQKGFKITVEGDEKVLAIREILKFYIHMLDEFCEIYEESKR